MKIIIHDKRRIHEIQKEFSEIFPSLRVDFFEKPQKFGGASPKKLLIHHSKTIRECRTIHQKGELTILPEMKISELIKHFNDSFGLSARVYHKVGDNWLETVTETWTLEKQNRSSAEINSESILEHL